MWKPGDQKPKEVSKANSNGRGGGNQKNSQKKTNNNKNNAPKAPKSVSSSFSMGDENMNIPPQSSAPPLVKKRLSGGTMNMRFMKRKKETQDYEQNRRNAHKTPPKPEQSAAPVDDDNDNDDGMELETGGPGGVTFLEATPSDMYGMQADLMGRRSFGGFHVAMEEAWKECKASLERDDSKSNVTDEELVKRYQDLVQNKNARPGVVGNLKDKKRRQQQKR